MEQDRRFHNIIDMKIENYREKTNIVKTEKYEREERHESLKKFRM